MNNDKKEMKVITEKMHPEKEWFEDAKKQVLETLPAFMNHVLNDYCHDYGTIVHAISACALAATNAANKSEHGGITGYQAAFVMWDFIRQWMYSSNKCGLRIIDYDNMLYPQYEYKFSNKEIPQSIWESLQKQAEELLKTEKDNAHEKVIEHWQSIIDGNVPFGYKVKND